MKNWKTTTCAVVMALLAIGILYGYGLTPVSIVIAVILLICPVGVVWGGVRMFERTDQDIKNAVSKEGRKKS